MLFILSQYILLEHHMHKYKAEKKSSTNTQYTFVCLRMYCNIKKNSNCDLFLLIYVFGLLGTVWKLKSNDVNKHTGLFIIFGDNMKNIE